MKNDQIIETREYAGCKIHLLRDWRFYLEAEDGSTNGFGSVRDAQEAAEKHSKAKAVTERRKVSISAVKEDGTKTTVTGIHAGHGKLVAKPPVDGYGDVYCDVPRASQIISELQSIKKREGELGKELFSYRLTWQREGYESFYPDKHSEYIDRLLACAERAKGLAEQK